MTTRFKVDLLHPGRIAASWQDWFTEPEGQRRLVLFGGASVIVLILGYVGLVYFPGLRLIGDERRVAELKRVLAGRAEEARQVKADLGALSNEAKRQVRWSDLLTTFSEQTPPVLRLHRVSLTTAAPPPPPPGQAPGQAAPSTPVTSLQIEAQTPLRPGGPPLLETAKFMAGVMKDPAVNKRFQLRSWEIKPPASGVDPLLTIGVTLSERPQ
jgi:hypothetical protein